jgi:hypothetical protein
MIKEPTVRREGRRPHVGLGVRLKPLFSEFLESDLAAAAENREDPRPDLVQALMQDGLGLLLVGADRLPTLAAARTVIANAPLVATPDYTHEFSYGVANVSCHLASQLQTSLASKRSVLPKR